MASATAVGVVGQTMPSFDAVGLRGSSGMNASPIAFVAWSSNTEPSSASLMNLTTDVMTVFAEPEPMVSLHFANPRAGTLDVDQMARLTYPVI